MAIEISIGKKTYVSDKKRHAEEVMFADPKHKTGDLEVEMNGWPCTGERGHDCHALFKEQSRGRTITLTITDDHAGYAANHGKRFGAGGKIIYKQAGEPEYKDF
jgi:hypothetical protein